MAREKKNYRLFPNSDRFSANTFSKIGASANDWLEIAKRGAGEWEGGESPKKPSTSTGLVATEKGNSSGFDTDLLTLAPGEQVVAVSLHVYSKSAAVSTLTFGFALTFAESGGGVLEQSMTVPGTTEGWSTFSLTKANAEKVNQEVLTTWGAPGTSAIFLFNEKAKETKVYSFYIEVETETETAHVVQSVTKATNASMTGEVTQSFKPKSGNYVMVAIHTPLGVTGATGITDNKGNTYVLDAEVRNGTNPTMQHWRAKVGSEVTELKITGFGSLMGVNLVVVEVTPISALDVIGSNNATEAAVEVTTSSALRAGKGDFAITWFAQAANSVFTPGTGQTNIPGSGQTGMALAGEYTSTPAAGAALTAKGTFATSAAYSAAVVTYKVLEEAVHTISASLTSTGFLAKSTSRSLLAKLTSSGAVSRAVAKNFSAKLSLAGLLSSRGPSSEILVGANVGGTKAAFEAAKAAGCRVIRTDHTSLANAVKWGSELGLKVVYILDESGFPTMSTVISEYNGLGSAEKAALACFEFGNEPYESNSTHAWGVEYGEKYIAAAKAWKEAGISSVALGLFVETGPEWRLVKFMEELGEVSHTALKEALIGLGTESKPQNWIVSHPYYGKATLAQKFTQLEPATIIGSLKRATESFTVEKEKTIGFQFTATTTAVTSGVVFQVGEAGSTATSVEVSVFSDSAGKPGSALDFEPATVALGADGVIAVYGCVASLTSGTKYWLMVRPTNGTLTVRQTPTGGSNSVVSTTTKKINETGTYTAGTHGPMAIAGMSGTPANELTEDTESNEWGFQRWMKQQQIVKEWTGLTVPLSISEYGVQKATEGSNRVSTWAEFSERISLFWQHVKEVAKKEVSGPSGLTPTLAAAIWYKMESSTGEEYGILKTGGAHNEEAESYKKFKEGTEAVPHSTGIIIIQALSAVLTSVGSFKLLSTKKLTASMTSSGRLPSASARPLLGSLSSSGRAVLSSAKRLSGSVAPQGSIRSSTAARISAILTSSGRSALSSTKPLIGSAKPVGSLRSEAAARLSAILSPVGSMRAQPMALLRAALSPAAKLSIKGQLVEAFHAALGLVSSQSRTSTRPVSASTQPSGRAPWLISRPLVASIAPLGRSIMSAVRGLRGTLTPSGTQPRSTGLTIRGSLSSSGSLQRLTRAALRGALTFVGRVERSAAVRFVASLKPQGGIVPVFISALIKAFNAVLSSTSRQNRTTARPFHASAAPTGTLRRRTVSLGLSAALGLSGRVGRGFVRPFRAVLGLAGRLAIKRPKPIEPIEVVTVMSKVDPVVTVLEQQDVVVTVFEEEDQVVDSVPKF